MKFANLNLTNEKGVSVKNTNIELSDLADASVFFGEDFAKDGATFRDVAEWCKRHITRYKRYIQNLQTVLVTTNLMLNEGMSSEEFKAFVAQKGKLSTVAA